MTSALPSFTSRTSHSIFSLPLAVLLSCWYAPKIIYWCSFMFWRESNFCMSFFPNSKVHNSSRIDRLDLAEDNFSIFLFCPSICWSVLLILLSSLDSVLYPCFFFSKDVILPINDFWSFLSTIILSVISFFRFSAKEPRLDFSLVKELISDFIDFNFLLSENNLSSMPCKLSLRLFRLLYSILSEAIFL